MYRNNKVGNVQKKLETYKKSWKCTKKDGNEQIKLETGKKRWKLWITKYILYLFPDIIFLVVIENKYKRINEFIFLKKW